MVHTFLVTADSHTSSHLTLRCHCQRGRHSLAFRSSPAGLHCRPEGYGSLHTHPPRGAASLTRVTSEPIRALPARGASREARADILDSAAPPRGRGWGCLPQLATPPPLRARDVGLPDRGLFRVPERSCSRHRDRDHFFCGARPSSVPSSGRVRGGRCGCESRQCS